MNYIGKSLPIHDAAGKVTGAAVYAGDMAPPGLLHLALVTSDIPHGTVRAVHTQDALALPGVVDVLHPFNTTQTPFNRYKHIYGEEHPDQERVFNRHVRFVGNRVACVIAETREAALAAVPLVRVEYDPLPHSTDPGEVLETGVLDGLHEEGAVYGPIETEVGERPDTAGAVVTETGGAIDRISHLTMETHVAVASYDRATGEVTVWSPNQSVHGLRMVLGELFGLPYHKLRVIKTTMGGSFGSKQEWMAEPVAVAAALHTGRPVKLVLTREQAFLSTVTRCALEGTVRSAVSPEGKILSLEADMVLDGGAYLGSSYDYCAALAGKVMRFYDLPHFAFSGRTVCTNAPVSGAFRGWASPEIYIFLEHHLNLVADRLGMDPVALRIKNAALPGSVDKKTGQPLGEIRGRECLERGAALFGWDERRAACRAFNASGGRYRRGAAVACGGHGNGYFPRRQDFGGADMRMAEDGTVTVNITLHDHGCGSVTAISMIVAETLGIPVDRVRVGEGDTAVTPFDVGCFASRTTYVLGRTAMDCAEKLKAFLVEAVAEIEGVAPDSLIVRDGVILSEAGDGPRYTYAQAAVASFRVLQREAWVTHRHINTTNPGVTGAHFALVQVDTWTGMVEILDYLAVHDIGQVINREITRGQIQGAVAMGAGAALSEAMVPDKSGRFTHSMKDYHVRNCPQVPEVRVEFIEDGGTQGPFGAKSIGELALVPVAPAIVGAVNDALGSALCHLPLTPERIVRHLAEGGTPCNYM